MEAGEEEEVDEEEEEEEQEEEAWLDALEAGEVNERGYLPHKQDSASLTARQASISTLESWKLFPANDYNTLFPPSEGHARWRRGGEPYKSA